jgi:hypothetical protein
MSLNSDYRSLLDAYENAAARGDSNGASVPKAKIGCDTNQFL